MSTFADLYRGKQDLGHPHPIPIIGAPGSELSQVAMVHDNQIQALVQQLFLRNVTTRVRNVAFVPIEATNTISGLCLDVARCLADRGKYDVALVDCGSAATPLPDELHLAPIGEDHSSWLIAPHLWIVTRNDWVQDAAVSARAQQASRLRELNSEFDFSIFRCEPLSTLETAVPQSCDGVVLVLAANKTRRLVASQIRDQLEEMKVPVLGSVLSDRRFPIPTGLYRKL